MNRLAGVPAEWRPIAQRYIKVWDAAGVAPAKVDQLIAWGVNFRGSEKDLLSAFQVQAERMQLPSDQVGLLADIGMETREHINKHGIQQEAPDADATLLADIRNYRQQWPDAYSADEDMKRAELRLIDKELGNKPDPMVGPKPEPGKVVVQPGSRMADIRQIMRDDPDAYNRSPALQAEQLGLIEAQLAASRTAAPTEITATPAPAAATLAPAAPQGGTE